MGLETNSSTVSFLISKLNSAWPLGGDIIDAGDNHIRNVKAALLNTFPNITGKVTASHTEMNLLVGATDTVASISARVSSLGASLITSQSTSAMIATQIGDRPTSASIALLYTTSQSVSLMIAAAAGITSASVSTMIATIAVEVDNGAGQIGSFAMLYYEAGGSGTVTPGDTFAASGDLKYATMNSLTMGAGGGSPSGTWRALNYAVWSSGSYGAIFLAQRIS